MKVCIVILFIVSVSVTGRAVEGSVKIDYGHSKTSENEQNDDGNNGEGVPPLEFIEETVILGEDIINPDNRIELTLTNTDNPSSILSTEAPPETPPTEPVIVLAEPENEAPPTAEDSKLYRLVQRLLNETPLIDGHNDLPWNIRQFLHGRLSELDFNSDLKQKSPWATSPWSHTDLPRLRKGKVGAQFWVAYAPCRSSDKDAVQITIEQIDLITRLVAQYPDHMKLALTADDIVQAHKEGKIASLIGVEGGHSIGNSLGTLRTFYELGVRYLTLTHTCNTAWGDSSVVDTPGNKPQHGGLTEFGRTVIKEMNRLGMIIDLSHTSKLTMMDALMVSKAPVIFSHSSAYALCNSPRNVNDDILQELVHNRGLIMVTFYNYFVKCTENATVRDVADHINYIRLRFGVQRIGLGGDFDGINRTPVGLEDVSKYPTLFVELARNPSWTNDDLKRVAGENFLRVFREVEHERDSMRSSGVEPFQLEIAPEYLGESAKRCKYNETSSTSGNASIPVTELAGNESLAKGAG